MSSQLPLAHRYLGHLRVEATDVVCHGDSAESSVRERLAPACFRGSQFQRAKHSRRFSEQTAAQLQWIFSTCHCQLVHETLGEEGVLRVSHRAPIADRDSRIRRVIFHQNVGYAVENIRYSLHTGAIHAVLNSTEANV